MARNSDFNNFKSFASAFWPHRPVASTLVADFPKGKREFFSSGRYFYHVGKKTPAASPAATSNRLDFHQICGFFCSARAVLEGGWLCLFEAACLG
jgi:hypothetical protein